MFSVISGSLLFSQSEVPNNKTMLIKTIFSLIAKGSLQKKNRGFSEFGTKGGRVSDLNHYFEQQWNSEKGEGVEEKDTCKKLKIIMENNSITLNVYIWCFIWVQFSLCALKSDKFYDII